MINLKRIGKLLELVHALRKMTNVELYIEFFKVFSNNSASLEHYITLNIDVPILFLKEVERRRNMYKDHVPGSTAL